MLTFRSKLHHTQLASKTHSSLVYQEILNGRSMGSHSFVPHADYLLDLLAFPVGSSGFRFGEEDHRLCYHDRITLGDLCRHQQNEGSWELDTEASVCRRYASKVIVNL